MSYNKQRHRVDKYGLANFDFWFWSYSNKIEDIRGVWVNKVVNPRFLEVLVSEASS